MYGSADKNAVTRGPKEPSAMFPLGAVVQYLQIQHDFTGRDYCESWESPACTDSPRLTIFQLYDGANVMQIQ